MAKLDSAAVTSDWDVVMRVLPANWEAQARDLGALRRARGIPDAATLLRVLFIHLSGGCSLVETALRAREAGLCSISAVAVHKRLKAAEEWLRWLAESFWRHRVGACEVDGRRLRVVDATIVSEGGRTGSQWRVHSSIDLRNLQCDFFELTDVRGGESYRRVPVKPGDLILGDRGYSRAPGIAHVVNSGGDVLVRLHLQSLPIFLEGGKAFPLLKFVRRLTPGEVGDWTAYVKGPEDRVRGRLVAIKRSSAATDRVRLRMTRRARHKQHGLSKMTLEAAGYVLLWTTLSEAEFDGRSVLEMYRWRWQIELSIKRMKSILGLGQLPKRTDASSKAWLHGKLLVALLLERLMEETESLSPWGYPIGLPSESMARNAVSRP